MGGERRKMNEELQSAFNIVVKYGFCGECRYNLDSRYCEDTMCYKAVNLIRDALEKSQTDEKIQTNS